MSLIELIKHFFMSPPGNGNVNQDPAPYSGSEGQCWLSPSTFNHWLFLDIDGVLHRAENGTLEYIPVLENVLERNSDVGIFLSTNWRIGLSKDELLNIFPPSVQNRIAGCTPDLDGVVPQYVRWHECMAVVSFFNLQSYTFIDDTARLFPDNTEELFLTKRHEGLNEKKGDELVDVIRLKTQKKSVNAFPSAHK